MSYGEPELSPQVVSQWLANEQATNRELRAEIERLKAELQGEIERSKLYAKGQDLIVRRDAEIVRLREIIGQLMDRLEARGDRGPICEVLLQRAREAIK